VFDVPTVIVLRTLAFVVEAILAYALASTREVTRRQVTDFVSLLDALRTPVMVSDIDGAILYANHPMCEITGYEIKDVKQSSLFKHFAFSTSLAMDTDEYTSWFLHKTGQGRHSKTLRSKSESAEHQADLSLLQIDRTDYLLIQVKAH